MVLMPFGISCSALRIRLLYHEPDGYFYNNVTVFSITGIYKNRENLRKEPDSKDDFEDMAAGSCGLACIDSQKQP